MRRRTGRILRTELFALTFSLDIAPANESDSVRAALGGLLVRLTEHDKDVVRGLGRIENKLERVGQEACVDDDGCWWVRLENGSKERLGAECEGGDLLRREREVGDEELCQFRKVSSEPSIQHMDIPMLSFNKSSTFEVDLSPARRKPVPKRATRSRSSEFVI